MLLEFGSKPVKKQENNDNKWETQSTYLLCVLVPQPNTDSSELTQIEQQCCDFSAQKWAPSANRTAPWSPSPRAQKQFALQAQKLFTMFQEVEIGLSLGSAPLAKPWIT